VSQDRLPPSSRGVELSEQAAPATAVCVCVRVCVCACVCGRGGARRGAPRADLLVMICRITSSCSAASWCSPPPAGARRARRTPGRRSISRTSAPTSSLRCARYACGVGALLPLRRQLRVTAVRKRPREDVAHTGIGVVHIGADRAGGPAGGWLGACAGARGRGGAGERGCGVPATGAARARRAPPPTPRGAHCPPWRPTPLAARRARCSATGMRAN